MIGVRQMSCSSAMTIFVFNELTLVGDMQLGGLSSIESCKEE